MKANPLTAAPEPTWCLVFRVGEELMEGLLDFVRAQHLASAQLVGIGAFSSATLGYFDWETKDYLRIPVQEQVELLSLAGNVAAGPDGEPVVHAHVTLGRRDGTALGGHLLNAVVRPTAEIMVTATPAYLQRRHDPATGLALIATSISPER